MGFFKNWAQRRIEKNTVESQLTYNKGHGDNKIEVIEDVLLKRSSLPLIGDWGRIYPPIDSQGKMNYWNLFTGGTKNFLKLLVILALILLLVYWTYSVIGAAAKYMNGNNYIIIPRDAFNKFCQTSIEGQSIQIASGNLTFGNFSIS